MRPPKETRNEEAGGMTTEEEDQLVERSEKVASCMKEDFEGWLEQELYQNDVTALIFYRGLF